MEKAPAGKDLYDRFEDVVINELQGQKVNMGLVNQAKALLKGKSVFDTVSDLKDAKEKIEELKEN